MDIEKHDRSLSWFIWRNIRILSGYFYYLSCSTGYKIYYGKVRCIRSNPTARGGAGHQAASNLIYMTDYQIFYNALAK